MKSLVVFYSRTGTTKKVAEAISKKLNADIEEIVDLKSRKGILGFFSGGKDAFKKELTKIKKTEKNPADYDLVLIGSPIWAGTMVPAVRTYLNDAKIKKAAFFATGGSPSPQRVFPDMHEMIVDTQNIGQLYIPMKEVKKGAEEKIEEFVKRLV
jgi:flavodoxin